MVKYSGKIRQGLQDNQSNFITGRSMVNQPNQILSKS